MELAYEAGKKGGTMPAVLNAANEEAVAQFLNESIPFLEIPKMIESACEKHKVDFTNKPNLDEVLSVDHWARNFVREEVKRRSLQMPLNMM